MRHVAIGYRTNTLVSVSQADGALGGWGVGGGPGDRRMLWPLGNNNIYHCSVTSTLGRCFIKFPYTVIGQPMGVWMKICQS